MPWIDGKESEDIPVLTEIALTRDSMSERLRGHWDEAEFQYAQPDYQHPRTGRLNIGGYRSAEILESGNCTYWGQKGSAWPYEQCTKPAGHRTLHEGVGLCYSHGGNNNSGKVRGAVLMAMSYAEELDVTPWEALLSQVRLLANQVEWLRLRVLEAESKGGAEAIRPGGSDFDWVLMLDTRGDRLAKVSKMAIDSGVAERLVRQIELEAAAMFRAAIAGLEAAGIEGEQRELFLEKMAGKLLEIEGEHRV